MEGIFLMTKLNLLIKTVNKAEETFVIFDIKVYYSPRLCSFKLTFF